MGGIQLHHIQGDDLQKIVCLTDLTPYLQGYIDGNVYNASGPTWDTDRAFITQVIVVTSSSNWSMNLYADSDKTSGLYGIQGPIPIAVNATGSKIISLGMLPYIDNDGAKQLHLEFFDYEYWGDLTVTILGIKAR